MDPRLRALNGFGLGARVGERERIADPRGWLRTQIDASAAFQPKIGVLYAAAA
jgi:uncharacterized protein (DUF1800 family)